MATPTTAFADAAAKYGDVDPEDIEAVQKWFTEALPTLPLNIIDSLPTTARPPTVRSSRSTLSELRYHLFGRARR